MNSLAGLDRLAGFGRYFFHASGMADYIMAPLYGLITVALFPPRVTKPDVMPITATAENIIEHLERSKATALAVQLNFLSDFARSEKAISVLRSMTFVVSLVLLIAMTTIKMYSSLEVVLYQPESVISWFHAEFVCEFFGQEPNLDCLLYCRLKIAILKIGMPLRFLNG
jgi:hypothetical protein